MSPYRVTLPGISVECDSPQEAIEFVRAWEASPAKASAPPRIRKEEPAPVFVASKPARGRDGFSAKIAEAVREDYADDRFSDLALPRPPRCCE